MQDDVNASQTIPIKVVHLFVMLQFSMMETAESWCVWREQYLLTTKVSHCSFDAQAP